MSKPTVSVTITGDEKGLERALQRSAGGLSSFKTTALGVFAGNLLTKGFDLLGQGIAKFADFAQEGTKLADAYGDSLALLDAKARGLSKSVDKLDLAKFGVDKTEAATSAVAIASVADSLGLSDKALNQVVPGLTKLSAQYSALRDMEPADAAKLFANALKGSSKAAAQLGVELPKGAKGLDAYQAILSQLGPQLDTAASGTRSLADEQASWDAQLSNLQLQVGQLFDALAPVLAQLGSVLMPILQRLVEEFAPLVVAAIGGIATAFSSLFASAGDTSTTVGKVASALGRIGAFIVDNVLPALGELFGAIATQAGPILEQFAELWLALEPAITAVWSIFAKTLLPFLSQVVIPVIGTLVRLFLKLVTILATTLSAAVSTLMGWLDKLHDALKPVLDLLGKAGDLIGSVGGAIGGIVGGTAAPAAPATAGVRGARLGASGGLSITVQAGIGDPVAIGKSVARVLDSYALRGGIVR